MLNTHSSLLWCHSRSCLSEREMECCLWKVISNTTVHSQECLLASCFFWDICAHVSTWNCEKIGTGRYFNTSQCFLQKLQAECLSSVTVSGVLSRLVRWSLELWSPFPHPFFLLTLSPLTVTPPNPYSIVIIYLMCLPFSILLILLLYTLSILRWFF